MPQRNSRPMVRFMFMLYGGLKVSSMLLVIAKDAGASLGKPPGGAAGISAAGRLYSPVNRGAVVGVRMPEP